MNQACDIAETAGRAKTVRHGPWNRMRMFAQTTAAGAAAISTTAAHHKTACQVTV